jgi:hypothetical protein
LKEYELKEITKDKSKKVGSGVCSLIFQQVSEEEQRDLFTSRESSRN